MRNRKTCAAAVAVLLTVLFAGCGNAGLTPGGSSINVLTVELPDGETVTCVSVGGSSVDCDWGNAR